MRRKGTISTWNDDKGFGFVSPQSGDRRVFVHIKEFSNRDVRPQLNDVVTYALSKDDQGRICAISASIAGARRKKKPARRGRASAIVLVLLFLAVVAASTADDRIPAAVIITYAVLSLIAFIAYAIDKSAARRGAWRIKEGTLHILGLMGGWPGGLLAQQTLRHKSKKTSFRVVFWLTVLANCSALIWLHTDSGQALLGEATDRVAGIMAKLVE